MKTQVHITVGSSAGRGKTSTAIEMFAQQVCKPDMQLFFSLMRFPHTGFIPG